MEPGVDGLDAAVRWDRGMGIRRPVGLLAESPLDAGRLGRRGIAQLGKFWRFDGLTVQGFNIFIVDHLLPGVAYYTIPFAKPSKPSKPPPGILIPADGLPLLGRNSPHLGIPLRPVLARIHKGGACACGGPCALARCPAARRGARTTGYRFPPRTGFTA